MLNKRGISPLIATVLIIGFTIVLAVLVIAWLSGVFQQNLEEQDCTVELQNFCGDLTGLLKITAEETFTGSEVTVNVAWLGDTSDAPPLAITLRGANLATLGTASIDSVDYSQGLATEVISVIQGTNLNGATVEVRAKHTPIVPGIVCSEKTCSAISKTVTPMP